jgi:hypothetical protein
VDVLLVVTLQIVASVLWWMGGKAHERRKLDVECELAYLSGHVDGYNRAVFDSGEAPW